MKKLLIVTGIAALLSFVPFASILFFFLLGPFSVVVFFGPSFFLYSLVTSFFWGNGPLGEVSFKKKSLLFLRSLFYTVVCFSGVALILNLPTYITVHQRLAEDLGVAGEFDKGIHRVVFERRLETNSGRSDDWWNIFASTVQAQRLEVYRSADNKLVYRRTFITAKPLVIPFLIGNVEAAGPIPINALVRKKKCYNCELKQAFAQGASMHDVKRFLDKQPAE